MNLTFLLTLKDKSELNPAWCKHNLRKGYKYYIADGSLNKNNNEQLFNEAKAKGNIDMTYNLYPPDRHRAIFVAKLISSLYQVNTSHVMLIDNDDLILFDSIDKIIRKYPQNEQASCIIPNVSIVSHEILYNEKIDDKLNLKYNFERAALNNFSITQMVDKYLPYHYSIFSTRFLRELFEYIAPFASIHWIFSEIFFNAYISLHQKRPIYAHCVHYRRSRGKSQGQSSDIGFSKDFCLNLTKLFISNSGLKSIVSEEIAVSCIMDKFSKSFAFTP